MSKLIIFCGIPGSGKSTVAKMVAARLKDTVHVETDDVRAMIPSPRYSSFESEFVYSACFAVAKEALARGYNVILDGTFLRDEYREDALGRLRGAYDSYLVVFLRCDVTTAYQRNKTRNANVPQGRFNQMLPQIQVPADALKIDTEKASAEEAAETVLLQLGESRPTQPKLGDA